MLFLILTFQTILPSIISGDIHDTVHTTRDENGCLITKGFSWCEDLQSCIRIWETPCLDNFIDCNDCLTKQRNGYNIACPTDCDLVEIEPPIVMCPEVMCMMYCEFGNMIDSNGCQICQCNEELSTPVIQDSNTDSDCSINIPCDEYIYICPKITEITNCNMGGIDGYSTYRLFVSGTSIKLAFFVSKGATIFFIDCDVICRRGMI